MGGRAMTEVETLLTRAHTLGATFTPEGDRLKVLAPAPLPDDLINSLRRNKTALLALLKQPSPDMALSRSYRS